MQDQTHPTFDAAIVSGSAQTAAIPEEGASTMFCTQCGTRNGSDARYCKQCGHKMERTGPLRISEEEFKLPESREERVRDLLVFAYQKYEASDLDAAIAACGEAVELRPESTDAHSLMSTLYEKKGDNEKAIVERERVLDLNPGSIADREKLDELREGKLSVTPRKITTSRRSTSTVLVDSPVAQAFAAIFVMLVVMVVGLGMMWAAKSGRTSTASAANPPAVNSAGAALVSGGLVQGNQGAVAAPGQNQAPVQNANLATNAAPNAPLNNGQVAPGQILNRPVNTNAATPATHRPATDRFAGSPLGARPIGPATVNPGIGSEGGRLGNGALPDRGTVILPDTGPETTPGIGTPTNTTRNGGATLAGNPAAVGTGNQGGTRPNPPQGKIEIIVSPGPGVGGEKTATSKGNGADSGSSLDSRSALEIARDLHNRGQYSKAVNNYVKALDGAGDSAADIHQKIALCYYRLGDKENAVAHYQHAIESFKGQISAGRNLDSAKNGIRACENGIKVCQ